MSGSRVGDDIHVVGRIGADCQQGLVGTDLDNTCPAPAAAETTEVGPGRARDASEDECIDHSGLRAQFSEVAARRRHEHRPSRRALLG